MQVFTMKFRSAVIHFPILQEIEEKKLWKLKKGAWRSTAEQLNSFFFLGQELYY